ncbi:MFS general substrate transporter [Wolfiporia cocos MD-104 SS10]|uniref:MFS general substrate transporter n=1 Tax=Wolfiporia cocos (strain MD-104) TaxID=742152 RepID=A0A2H3JYI8_WOLCO|nr:MFS general substrate transporter [Wolfiporia cocos MD-104 SS10]
MSEPPTSILHARPLFQPELGAFEATSPLHTDGIELVELGAQAESSSKAADVAEEITQAPPQPTPLQRQKANIQFAAMCFALFLAGWNDGTTGPLLPRIQKVYHIGFAVASLIFVSNCLGFIFGAGANVALTDRLGFGTVMVIGSVFQMAAYSLTAPAPPFPVFVLGFGLNGFGGALQDAGANGYVGCLAHGAETKMGILHAVYGELAPLSEVRIAVILYTCLGAMASPFVATQFAEFQRWSFSYLISLAIALLNTLFLVFVLRFRTQDDCLAEIGQPVPERTSSDDNKYKQIFRLRAVHVLAAFILVYVGIEVAIGGWIVTYIVDVRDGGSSSGYISSGFFGGLMLGRVALLWLNKAVGERTILFIYILLAVGLELVIWLVPSLIGNAVAIAFVGLFLGPVYPIAMNHAGRILPQYLLTGCISWIAGFGQAGSALIPFLTGLLASREGIKSMQPMLVTMMSLMVGLWAIVPNHSRRID